MSFTNDEIESLVDRACDRLALALKATADSYEYCTPGASDVCRTLAEYIQDGAKARARIKSRQESDRKARIVR